MYAGDAPVSTVIQPLSVLRAAQSFCLTSRGHGVPPSRSGPQGTSRKGCGLVTRGGLDVPQDGPDPPEVGLSCHRLCPVCSGVLRSRKQGERGISSPLQSLGVRQERLRPSCSEGRDASGGSADSRRLGTSLPF